MGKVIQSLNQCQWLFCRGVKVGKTLVSFLIPISSTLAALVSATSHRLYDRVFKLQRCTAQGAGPYFTDEETE